MRTYYEATAQERQLIAIGRDMMDYSENYGKVNGLARVTDNGLRVLNDLSYVGNKLTHYGAPFGTTKKDFSEAEMELISQFMQKKVDIERK